MKARIGKGAYVWGTFRGSPKLQGVTRVVDVFDLFEKEIVWAGSGGYWHRARLDDPDVDLLDEVPS